MPDASIANASGSRSGPCPHDLQAAGVLLERSPKFGKNLPHHHPINTGGSQVRSDSLGFVGDHGDAGDNVNDVIVENTGEGTDTVRSFVNYSLAGQFLENLTVVGSANLTPTGNSLGNVLNGNAGANAIDGGLGNDVIDGGERADTLTGGFGADRFVFASSLFASNVDTITDFNRNEGDRIQLDDAIFSQAGALGTLGAQAFHTGSAAHVADDRIVYDPTNGWLWYDADGNGQGAAQHFATIGTGLGITNADFLVA